MMGVLDGTYAQPRTRSRGVLTTVAVVIQVLAFFLFAISIQDSFGNFRLLFPNLLVVAVLQVLVGWLIRLDWRKRKP